MNTERPEFIVKYFSPGTKRHFLNGKFKFGTLQEYASAESNNGVMSDDGEGSVHTTMSSGYVKEGYIGEVYIRNTFMDARDVAVNYRTEINEWIFCASDAPYSRKHHHLILNGASFTADGNTYTYPPNRSYTEFALIDFRKFCSAIKYSARSLPEFEAQGNYVITGKVGYNSRTRSINPDMISSSMGNSDIEAWWHTIFMKSARFAPEQEVRTVLRLRSPTCAPLNAEPVFLRSEALRESIVEFGKYSP